MKRKSVGKAVGIALAMSLAAGCAGGGGQDSQARMERPDDPVPPAPDSCNWSPDPGELLARSSPQTADPGSELVSVVTITDAGIREGFEFPVPMPKMPAEPMPALELSFAVTRSGNLDNSVVVHYSSHSDTAAEYADYEPVEGYVAFAPQEQVKYIRVPVRNDVDPECTERFTLRLRPASTDVVVVNSGAFGYILDDDGSESGGGRPHTVEPFEPTLEPPANDYCETLVSDALTASSPCVALSCATGETLYWTHCPGTQPLHTLLAATQSVHPE